MPGKTDGAFDKAEFDDPQGMALIGDTLYVADRKNHVIRELDLKAKTVEDDRRHRQQEHDARDRRLDKPVAGQRDRPEQPVGLAASTATRSTSPWPGTTRSGRST